MPSWDNTPRRQNDSTVFIKNSPEWFEFWLTNLNEYTKRNLGPDEQFIFINAWNEWAEGAYIQPDSTSGAAYLEAIRNSTSGIQPTKQSRFFGREGLSELYNFYSETEGVTIRTARKALRTRPRGTLMNKITHSLQLNAPTLSKYLRSANILIRKLPK
jgi:hypothetical protein